MDINILFGLGVIAVVFAIYSLRNDDIMTAAASGIMLILLGMIMVGAGTIDTNECFSQVTSETNTYGNATITTLADGNQYNVSIGSVNIVRGTLTSGNESNISVVDGVDMIVNEQAGAVGLDVRFNITGNFTLSNSHVIAHRGFFNNKPSDIVIIQLWNFQTTTFDSFTIMPDSEVDVWHNFTVSTSIISKYLNEFNGGGTEVMIVRFLHSENGNTNHEFSTDLLAAFEQVATTTTTDNVVLTSVANNNTITCNANALTIDNTVRAGFGWMIAMLGLFVIMSAAYNRADREGA